MYGQMDQLFDILVNCITSSLERGLKSTNYGTLDFCDLRPPCLLYLSRSYLFCSHFKPISPFQPFKSVQLFSQTHFLFVLISITNVTYNEVHN